MSDKICKNTERGVHIKIRCAGCNSIHSTKNIGGINGEGQIFPSRTIFDLGIGCRCNDPKEFPLIHICGIDCKTKKDTDRG